MVTWNKRSPEVANLLNPAFCSLLIRWFVDGYYEVTQESTPYILLFTIFPFVLSAQVRNKLPQRYNPRSKLISFVHNHPEIKMTLPNQVINTKEITREAILFGIQKKLFELDEFGLTGKKNGKVDISIWEKGSESLDCLNKAKLLGQLFANTGDASTVCIVLGIMP